MSTVYLSHPAFLNHETPYGHPERADRLRAIDQALEAERFMMLAREAAPLGTIEQAMLAHPEDYVRMIEQARPSEGISRIDADTSMSPGSWEAALRAIGAAVQAVDEVIAKKAANAFCAIRPPGHHAEAARAMGFCLFNNAAIAALHA
ncbi:MAG: histone deacetylase family protein, partial [Hyphomicrobiales bacterium]|nr:histone deacetylase family protein [Hyphomicrobiales bacterium]